MEKLAEEHGSLLATAAILSFVELWSRLIRSCREATLGVTSALDARAAIYLAAAVTAGTAWGSPTGVLELSPCSKRLWFGMGGGALVPECTQV
jgi:hypothetical protein